MTTKEERLTKISFPFALYFKQLFAADAYVKFVNPFNFWRRYKINHLETCQELDVVEHLEHCHQAEWRSTKTCNSRTSENSTKTLGCNFSPFKQADLNTILIFQPSVELKYRGVKYHTKEIISINIQNVNINFRLAESNNLKQPLNSNQTNTPEKSGSNEQINKVDI